MAGQGSIFLDALRRGLLQVFQMADLVTFRAFCGDSRREAVPKQSFQNRPFPLFFPEAES